MKINKLTITIILTVTIIAIFWHKYISKTKIAVINFRDFQYSQMMDAVSNNFIQIDRIDKADLAEIELSDYAITFIFGMGLRLDDQQADHIRSEINKGAQVYVHASTSSQDEFTNLTAALSDKISSYLENGEETNICSLFNFCRKELDHKLFAGEIKEPIEVPTDNLFHTESDEYFTDFNAYQHFYQESGHFKKGQPKVCIIASMVSSGKSKHTTIGMLIDKLENENINVYPISGMRKRLQFIKEVEPDLVVYFPHGRLNMMAGDSELVIEWLKQADIPLMCPISVQEPYDQWLSSQQGMTGGMLSQSIVMPELDGGIEPYALSAQFPDKRGLMVSGPIERRIGTFVSRVGKWLALQSKPNDQKKIVIVYYKGPGKNALVASGMEVVPSLYNVLQHLSTQGYNTGTLPDSYEQLEKMIQNEGAVLGEYAEGAFEDSLISSSPEMIPAEEYLDWVSQSLDPDVYQQVENLYGPAPGEYLSTMKDGKPYLALPRLQFGNIVLMPQLLPAFGDDENKLVHGVKLAPPHPYIAEYLWAAKGFKADAIIHFGTHGSLEFTPWKQNVLSHHDWPDILIGDLPHPYIYTINNIGEAVIAKRRSYASLVSHLTPPFMESDLYGPLSELDRAVEAFETTEDMALKTEYNNTIIEKTLELGIDKDLQLENLADQGFNEESLEKLHQYLHQIAQEKVTRGMYVLGRKYQPEFALETASLMAIEPVTYGLLAVDKEKGIIDLDKDETYSLSEYHQKAADIIDSILTGKSAWQQYITADDLNRLSVWDDAHKKLERSMSSMSMPSGSAEKEETKIPVSKDLTTDTSKKPFGHPANIPIPGVYTPPTTEYKVETEQTEIQPEIDYTPILAKLTSDEYKSVLFQTADTKKYPEIVSDWSLETIVKNAELLEFCSKHCDISDKVAQNGGKDDKAVAAILKLGSAHLARSIDIINIQRKKLENSEMDYVNAVRNLKQALEDVTSYHSGLLASTDAELETLTRVLNGGYIPPSTGGDPLVNPSSVPTGRNLTALNMDTTPTPQAWKIGIKLVESTIQSKLQSTGNFPKKVAVTLWGGELIRSEGTQLAMIFNFLGVEPVRNSRGTVYDVKLIDSETLGRPRIDVVVQTSGQARDIAASRLFLINKAVKMATEAAASDKYENYVAQGTKDAERVMKEKGMNPIEAQKFATSRIFGGVNGNYGTGIMGLVEAGDRWEDDSEITDQYLKNMGAIYTEENWSFYQPGIFEAALQNTDTVIHNRSSNTSGPLSLDHVYEFMGSINAVVRNVTGSEPDAMFSDLRNKYNPKMQGVKEAIWVEARTSLMNPKYIIAMQQEEASAADTFAETFRNTYAWNVLKPEAIDKELWEGFYDVYIEDSLNLDMQDYFRDKNPYALQEMTAVMLETIRKGYWQADAKTIKTLSELHVELVKDFNPGCSGFVCNNAKLKDMIADNVSPQLAQQYKQQISDIRDTSSQTEQVEGMKLEKQELTFDKIKETISDNMLVVLLVLGVVIALISVVIIGINRRR